MTKNKYKFFLKWIITVLTLTLAIRILILNIDDAAKFLSFELWQVLSIFFLYLLLFIASRVPLFYLIKTIFNKTLSFGAWLHIMIISTMINMIMPQTGSIYRAVAFKEEHDLLYTQYIYVFTLFSWITTLIDLLLALIIISVFFPELKISSMPAIFLIGIVFLVIFLGPILFIKTIPVFNPNNACLLRIIEKKKNILSVIKKAGFDFKLLIKIFIFSLLSFALSVMLFNSLFAGIDVDIGYAHIAVLVVIRKISSIIVITPGNIGVQELIYGAVCEAIGIAAAQGVLVSMLLRILSYIVIFPVGIIIGGHKYLVSSKR